jgi:hypothetical protein
MKFPDRFRPSNIRIRVSNADIGAGEDHSETEYAERQLIYNRDSGTVFLGLQWLLPRHRYTLLWDLPRPPTRSGQELAGDRALQRLLEAKPERRLWLDGELRTVRDRICRQLGGEEECDFVDLALFGFDAKQGEIALIAGTYPNGGPESGARLRWGEGIQGLALRRGMVEDFDCEGANNAYFYTSLPNCEPDTHMFCVPIPLPARAAEPRSGPLEPTTPRVVAALSSRRDSVLQILQDAVGVSLYGHVADVLERVGASGRLGHRETSQNV